MSAPRRLPRAIAMSTAEEFTRQIDPATPALTSQDAAEGILAFTQKRNSVWQGR